MISFGIRFIQITSFAAGLSAMSTLALADTGHSHGAAIGEPAKASVATRTIEIRLLDTYYEPARIQVRPGETIRFVLTNTGELLHDFMIGTPEMHAKHQKEMAAMMEHGMLTPTGINDEMMTMDHSTMGMHMPMKHDDSNAVLVEPGETKELIWRFAQPAQIEFACNIPGHYQSGMVGRIEFGR